MGQRASGLYSILGNPMAYKAVQKIFGSTAAGWRKLVNEHIRPPQNARILDIGCGPADILEYLPGVNYYGFDSNPAYIKAAQRRYGQAGIFYCGLVEEGRNIPNETFDLVLALGVLHHLDDQATKALFRLAEAALRPGGRLVTLDGCLIARQNPLARFFIKHDRGRNVRTPEEYLRLAREVFSDSDGLVAHRRWLPYTHWIMQCSKPTDLEGE